MFEKFEGVVVKFQQLEDSLASGQLTSDQLMKASKERAALEPVVAKYHEYKETTKAIGEAKEMLGDPEMGALAKEELSDLEAKLPQIERELTLLSLPTDPNDHKDIFLEVRAGTGGEEASIFVGDLYRMYTRYAEGSNWKVEVMSTTESSGGSGYKEIICLIKGDSVYSRLKFESGVHRVQRVPTTESQGRVHTSACTVAVLPEVDEVEIDINPSDLEISICRASGAGGQHVNTTDSAVRIVHKPTGIAVECQDERSQHKNKDKAMKVLRARMYEKAEEERLSEISADRKSQVGSGDRSERIRTYNFPQGRLTDHRINLTLYKLAAIMEGDLGEVLDALGTDFQAKQLENIDQQ